MPNPTKAPDRITVSEASLYSLALVDIDGVLLNCGHRLHWVSHKEKNYDMFYSEGLMKLDTPIRSGIDLINALTRSGYDVVFVTGRPERTREVTENMLKDICGFDGIPVYMREDGDVRPSYKVKEAIIEELYKSYYIGVRPSCLFIDDTPANCQMVYDNFSSYIKPVLFGMHRLNEKEKE